MGATATSCYMIQPLWLIHPLLFPSHSALVQLLLGGVHIELQEALMADFYDPCGVATWQL